MATSKQPPSRSNTGRVSPSSKTQANRPAAIPASQSSQQTSAQSHKPTVEQIQARAYELYVEGGRQEGMSEQHWAQAEAELSASSR